MKKFISHFLGKARLIQPSRLVFFAKDKPSSAPQEGVDRNESMQEAPSLDHMKNEVDRFENNIKGFLKNMEVFYNKGNAESLQITISTTEFNEELASKYKKAGMGEKAILAIRTLVESLDHMKSALARQEDSNRMVLGSIDAVVSTINDTMKQLSADDLYGRKIHDPLNADMTPAKLNELKMREEEERQAAAAEGSPEIKEATTNEKVQSSIIAVVQLQDHMVDVQALLDKCAGKQFSLERKEGSQLFTQEMEDNGLLRAIVTPSTDNKSVRVEYWISGSSTGRDTVNQIRQEVVFHLDPERKDTPEFPQITKGMETQDNLNKNRDKFRQDITWLKAAPVGSAIEFGNGVKLFKDADNELYSVGGSGKDVPIPYVEEKSEDGRVTEGSILLVQPDKAPERVPASAPESKEAAMKKVKKIAKNMIDLASAPQTEGGDKILADMARELAEIAQINGLGRLDMVGTGVTGKKHFVLFENNKVAWGEALPAKEEDGADKKYRYASKGEVDIDIATA